MPILRITNAAILIILPISFVPAASAQINAGTIQSVWFSEQVFFAGDTVRVFVGLQNQSNNSISGNVVFRVDDNTIGTDSFEMQPNSVVSASTNWTPTKGTWSLSVIIADAVDENGNSVELSALGVTSVHEIDTDTDSDDVGDSVDEDDDNDGLTDEEEKERGTDPLLTDTDDDGVDDLDEINEGTDPLTADTKSAEEDEQDNSNDPPAVKAIKNLASVGEKVKDVGDEIAENIAQKFDSQSNSIINTSELSGEISTEEVSSENNEPESNDSKESEEKKSFAENAKETIKKGERIVQDNRQSLGKKVSALAFVGAAFLARSWLWVVALLIPLTLWYLGRRWARK